MPAPTTPVHDPVPWADCLTFIPAGVGLRWQAYDAMPARLPMAILAIGRGGDAGLWALLRPQFPLARRLLTPDAETPDAVRRGVAGWLLLSDPRTPGAETREGYQHRTVCDWVDADVLVADGRPDVPLPDDLSAAGAPVVTVRCRVPLWNNVRAGAAWLDCAWEGVNIEAISRPVASGSYTRAVPLGDGYTARPGSARLVNGDVAEATFTAEWGPIEWTLRTEPERPAVRLPHPLRQALDDLQSPRRPQRPSATDS
jgi:hypothetical protein